MISFSFFLSSYLLLFALLSWFSNFLFNIIIHAVPCLPPDYITFDVLSKKTSLKVLLKQILRHCRNGITPGYRVTYTRKKGNITWPLVNTTLPFGNFGVVLEPLFLDSNYSISVYGFSSKGESNGTYDNVQAFKLGKMTVCLFLTIGRTS